MVPPSQRITDHAIGGLRPANLPGQTHVRLPTNPLHTGRIDAHSKLRRFPVHTISNGIHENGLDFAESIVSVRTYLSSLARFLRAEEIPRWFGLSLVVIYLVGLATVTNLGISGVRSASTNYYQQSTRFALTQLADRIAAQQGEPAKRVQHYQRALRDFAAHMPVEALRVTNGQEILASTRESEIGANASNVPIAPSTTGDEPTTWMVQIPVRISPGAASERPDSQNTKPTTTTLHLIALLPTQPQPLAGLSAHGGIFATVLVLLGALFVTYRCVREQLRGVSRIGERLRARHGRIADDITALHITDTNDSVVQSWNALIELTEQLRDAADRREADAELSHALRNSGNDSLSEALNAVPDGIIHIKNEDSFAFVNTAAEHILGWDRDGYRTMKLSDCAAEGCGEEIIEMIREALRSDGVFESNTKLITPSDDTTDDTTYRQWILPLPRGDRDGECVIVIRDVSQQIRTERAREDFVTQVTHELRTPLTNIRAYAETLSSGMFDDPKVVTECYNVITKETRRLSRLVEDILSVSQLEVGSIALCMNRVNLRTLLEEGVRDVSGLADEKNIDIQLALPSKMEPIQGDRDKLAVVINNLLGNALKYTGEDGIIVVGFQQAKDEVVLTVKDNGIGVDPIDHARIFERFQRASDPDALAQSGTGIGLYTAREIVRRHNGEIELISEKGNGSTFLVRLPYEPQRTEQPIPAGS